MIEKGYLDEKKSLVIEFFSKKFVDFNASGYKRSVEKVFEITLESCHNFFYVEHNKWIQPTKLAIKWTLFYRGHNKSFYVNITYTF